ncbi:hypothetical protein G7054_g10186 [Neopestalotiopsis clavispora]|nr:hypothetical protein G7054_g10186 [Neopestalotiopsis clavispora]
MALYDQYSTFFKSNEFSDYTTTCNGLRLPAHRIVLGTNSPVIRRAMNSAFRENRERVFNFPEEDPAIVEKFLSVMYRGNYDDTCYGKVRGAHIITTLPMSRVRLVADGRCSHDKDKQDLHNLATFTRKNDLEQLETTDLIFETLQDALYLYLMGEKYQCDLVTAISHDRFWNIFELYFDKETFRDIELQKLVEFIDELYTNTTPDAYIRQTLCNQIQFFSRRSPELGQRLRSHAAGVLEAHPDFQKDMRSRN